MMDQFFPLPTDDEITEECAHASHHWCEGWVPHKSVCVGCGCPCHQKGLFVTGAADQQQGIEIEL